MIVKIEKEESEVIEKICAIFDLKCRIFTMENNPSLVQCEVTHADGSDIESHTAFHLAQAVQTKLEIKNL